MARLRVLKALARKLLQLCQEVIEGDVDLRDIPAVDKQHLKQEVRSDLLSILIDDAAAGHDHSVVLRLNSAPSDSDPFPEDAIRAANPAKAAIDGPG
jgi:hypothetical protein